MDMGSVASAWHIKYRNSDSTESASSPEFVENLIAVPWMERGISVVDEFAYIAIAPYKTAMSPN